MCIFRRRQSPRSDSDNFPPIASSCPTRAVQSPQQHIGRCDSADALPWWPMVSVIAHRYKVDVNVPCESLRSFEKDQNGMGAHCLRALYEIGIEVRTDFRKMSKHESLLVYKRCWASTSNHRLVFKICGRHGSLQGQKVLCRIRIGP